VGDDVGSRDLDADAQRSEVMHQRIDEPETPPRRLTPTGIFVVTVIVSAVLAALVLGAV
jgi:hypothetical protein